MKFVKIFLFLTLFSLNTGLAFANSDENSLDLDKVLAIAYENNLGLKIINKNKNINEGDLITAGLYPNPQFFAVGGVAQRTYNPGLQQTFPLGGKIKRRKEVAKARFDVIDKSIQQEAINLRYEVKNLFYQILTLEKKQETYQELLEITDQALKKAQRRFELKEITILDLNQLELMALNIRKQGMTINTNVKKQRNQLSQILNSNIENKGLIAYKDQEAELKKLLEEKSQEELIELALKNRPDIHTNDAMLQVNSQELRLAKANIYPDLTLGVAPDIVTGKDGSINAYAQIQMDLPIFNRQQGEIKRIKERAEQINLEKAQVKLLIEQEIKNSLNDYDLAKQQLALYTDDVLDKSKEFVKKAEKSYNLSKTMVLNFLEAVRTSQSIYLSYLDTKLSYQKSLLELEKKLGI